MKVRVIKPFFDLSESVERRIGDEFEATKERVDEINEAIPGFIEQVKAPRRASRKKEE